MKAVDAVPALLPTTVIDSYSLPRWLEVARESHKESRLRDAELEEAHDNAVKAWLKDSSSRSMTSRRSTTSCGSFRRAWSWASACST